MPEVVVFKYQLNIGLTELLLPADAKLLKVGVQNNAPVVWVQQSKEGTPHKHLIFYTVGTGHLVGRGTYFDTYQLKEADGSEFVGHVYVEGQ